MVKHTLYIGDTQTWEAPVITNQSEAEASFRLLGPSVVELPAKRSGNLFTAELTHTQSKTLASGFYHLAITYKWNEGKSQKTAILSTVELVPLPEVNGNYDARSVAQKALADCEAALSKFNASGGRVQSYTIAGRSMTFSSVSELLDLLNYWRSRVRLETKNDIGRRIRLVRF